MSNGSTSSTIELFQSTLSSRRATPNPITPSTATMDFNPRSPHGERPPFPREGCPSPPNFNPRSPHGERPRPSGRLHRQGNFNPRSPHGERPTWAVPELDMDGISIHALLTESDWSRADGVLREGAISIHALLTESDGLQHPELSGALYFNPRSPHGERLGCPVLTHELSEISIHALLTESDCDKWEHTCPDDSISIHALLTESDNCLRSVDSLRMYFNPRSPHGERRNGWISDYRPMHFNPRSPHGERQQIPPNWPYRFCLKCQF